MTGWRARALTCGGQVALDDESWPWVMRRLAADIHLRLYHDSGVEVRPASADPQWRASTPHCLQGDRPLGPLRLSRERAVVESWPAFRAWAFEELGVGGWATRRHLGCFHRRGKARYDLVFEVACELISTAPAGAMRLTDEAVPRFLEVSCCGEALAVLRTDGPASTAAGTVDLGSLFLSGLDVPGLAEAVRVSARHAHRAAQVSPRSRR